MASVPSAFSSRTFNFRSRAVSLVHCCFKSRGPHHFHISLTLKKFRGYETIIPLLNIFDGTRQGYVPMLTPALIDIFWVLLVSSRDEHARLSTIPDTASLFRHTLNCCVGPKRTEIPISSQLSRTVASSFSWCPLLCKDHIYPLLDAISGCSKSLQMVVCK